MWLFIGTGEKLEAVAGGRELERVCEKCQRKTMFYERKVTQRVSVYFLDLFAHSPRHIMACGACGAGFAVDHLEQDGFMDAQRGTALGLLGTVAGKARSAIEERGLSDEAARFGEAVGEAANQAKRSVNDWVKSRIKKS